MRARVWTSIAALAAIAACLAAAWEARLLADNSIDPAAWGADHVGEPIPNYATGTECLFCHRDYVGPRWPTNPHNRTMRAPDPTEPAMKALADAKVEGLKSSDVEMLLGDGSHVRFLKKLPEYGKASMASVRFEQDAGGKSPKDCLRGVEKAHWDDKRFAESCAGCHATGVDQESASMSSPSLECYVCHGLTEIEHTAKAVTAILSGKEPTEARVEISICGQCHLRGGKSKATGRPYPTNFVAGDNLFRDFQVDFSDAAMAAMDPIDRHIFANAKDVAVSDKKSLTCTSCHEVHTNSSKKHVELDETAYCAICHKPGQAMADVPRPPRRSSRICEYGVSNP